MEILAPNTKGSAMKNLLLLKTLLLTAALTLPNACAVIIEGSFNGTVRSFTNGAAEIDIAGYWDKTIIKYRF